MAITINPVPASDLTEMSFAFQEWVRNVSQLLAPTGATPGSIPWASVDKTGSDITDIVTRTHNSLQSPQGGTTAEYYHVTADQHNGIIIASPGHLISLMASYG